MRVGSAILTQRPEQSVWETSLNKMTLKMAPDEQGQASGFFFFDDGRNNLILLLNYTRVRITVQDNYLQSQTLKSI